MMFSEMLINSDEVSSIIPKFDFEVNKLCYNSKDIVQGDIFFALRGVNCNGNDFIYEALSRGASAVFSDFRKTSEADQIYFVEDCRKAMAVLSNIYYNFPSQKMKVIGVTGTNGKTTVTNIINYVLQYAGKITGLIGTNGNIINGKLILTEYTTPESVELNELMKRMTDEKVEIVTMEVSSHSLALSRVYGIDFDVAVFTNLTQDHLDFHLSMDNYSKAKSILFDSMKRINMKNNKTAVIYNEDDVNAERIISKSESDRISYGFGQSMYTINNLIMDFGRTTFELVVLFNNENLRQVSIKSKLTGKFNVYNLLAAIATLRYFNISFEIIQNAIALFESVEGRFSEIKISSGATAIIDYSHTPDSLLKAIQTINEILDTNNSNGRLITVFGCGGNRDKTKRSIMGAIATEYSNHVIITSDNPRDEEQMLIIEEIKSGIKKSNYEIEENRESAIVKAIQMSRKDDVILIAGKGHENYQIIKGVKHHFSDREVAERFSE